MKKRGKKIERERPLKAITSRKEERKKRRSRVK